MPVRVWPPAPANLPDVTGFSGQSGSRLYRGANASAGSAPGYAIRTVTDGKRSVRQAPLHCFEPLDGLDVTGEAHGAQEIGDRDRGVLHNHRVHADALLRVFSGPQHGNVNTLRAGAIVGCVWFCVLAFGIGSSALKTQTEVRSGRQVGRTHRKPAGRAGLEQALARFILSARKRFRPSGKDGVDYRCHQAWCRALGGCRPAKRPAAPLHHDEDWRRKRVSRADASLPSHPGRHVRIRQRGMERDDRCQPGILPLWRSRPCSPVAGPPWLSNRAMSPA